MNRLRFSSLVAFCTILTAIGCTSGSLSKTEYFAEYPSISTEIPNNEDSANRLPNYYRVSINGAGNNGEVKYRSGWYDKRAVDALFGSVSPRPSLEARTARMKREAIERTFKRYSDLLAKSESTDEQLKLAWDRYQKALAASSGITDLGNRTTSPLDNAAKKFVMIFSNDPTKIIGAIKNRVQQAKLGATVGAIVNQRSASQMAINRDRLDLLINEGEVLEAAIKSIDVTKANDYAALQRDLKTIIAVLESAR